MTLTQLKVRLLTSDLPAYEIAAKCGMHPSQLSKYALGQKEIAPKHLRSLCQFFRCKQGDLLGNAVYELREDW